MERLNERLDTARRALATVIAAGAAPFAQAVAQSIGATITDPQTALAAGDVTVNAGVTAALGLAAYTGIPLTHREHTSSVTFVTGHDPDQIDWTRVGYAETLVIYMGLTTIGDLAALSLPELQSQFGFEGRRIWELANGIDTSRAHRES